MSSGTNLLGTLNIGETAFTKCLIRRYVHSRKNIKSIDLVNWHFDASKLLSRVCWHTVTAYKKNKNIPSVQEKGGKKRGCSCLLSS